MRIPQLARFQSTHSLRSATRPPDSGRVHKLVSIHALLAECDPFPRATPRRKSQFQSTHSLRSATICNDTSTVSYSVSIHALLAECDLLLGDCHSRRPFQSTHSLRSATGFFLQRFRYADGFNPRTPCGVRLIVHPVDQTPFQFQSTHSLRSATGARGRFRRKAAVSIHALLAECDCGL